MAYANKYKIPFFDNLGYACEIYIMQDGYVGAVTELTPAATPCILTYNGNVSNKIDSIITSDINIGIVKQVGDDFSEFIESQEDYRIELYKDYGSGLELDWKGILIPDSYQEELQYPPIEVRLSGVCGLSSLKFFNYQVEDFDLGTTYIAKNVGVKTISEFLGEIFTKADGGILDMSNFYSFFDIQGYTTYPDNDFTKSFEYTYYFDSALAYDNNGKAKTYYQLLEDIAKAQLARVFQYKGEYYILSVPLYTTNTWAGIAQQFEDRVLADGGTVETTDCGANFIKEFSQQNLKLNKNDMSGTYVSTSTYNIVKKYDTDFIYALKDQVISYQSGIRNAQVTSKIDRGGPYINNFSFDTWLSTNAAPLGWVDYTGGLIIRQEYDNNPFNSNYEQQGSLISLGINSDDFSGSAPTVGDPYTLIS